MKNTSNINWLATDSTITVNIDGQTYMLGRHEALADKLLDALKNKRHEEVPDLVSTAKRIELFSEGHFVVQDGDILVDGEVCDGLLGQRIKEFSDRNLDYKPLVAFARNVRKNPSERAITDLYAFLEQNKHPITEEGYFVAYKKVRSDFKDIHTGRMDNSVGKKVSMPRAEVNDDPNQTCSRGLHCAAWEYASKHYGSSNDTLLEVHVNPKDVVAIPNDYNQQKMRVSSYVVKSVVDAPFKETLLRGHEDAISKSCADCEETCGTDYVCDDCSCCYDCCVCD
jgi:hypothetical protein